MSTEKEFLNCKIYLHLNCFPKSFSLRALEEFSQFCKIENFVHATKGTREHERKATFFDEMRLRRFETKWDDNTRASLKINTKCFHHNSQNSYLETDEFLHEIFPVCSSTH